jgi:hypothetical protein
MREADNGLDGGSNADDGPDSRRTRRSHLGPRLRVEAENDIRGLADRRVEHAANFEPRLHFNLGLGVFRFVYSHAKTRAERCDVDRTVQNFCTLGP